MPGRIQRFLSSRWAGFGLVVALLVSWQEASLHHVLDPVFIPPVTDIVHAGLDTWRDGTLRDALIGTILRFLQSYAWAVLLGVSLGVLMGYWRALYALLEPTIELLRPLPPPAVVPIAILLLGVEDTMKIVVTVFASFFPVVINTIQGIRGVDPILIDTARTFGYGRLAIVRRIVLPAAMPSIFAGMRISLAIALILTVLSEMVAGSGGVGYFILDAERAFRIPEMYAGVLSLMILGYVLNWIFVVVERYALHWYLERSGQE
jgi:ABC-type nitrate/sulfonate/bicarbonate transport system permease component